ncbi:hypothetical protein AB0952_27685 [Streptomyces caniferus]|uniref:hypothetical protein n=1 Tax=Streptomyces caniferus TaxID=285557 RepID=UPI0034537204
MPVCFPNKRDLFAAVCRQAVDRLPARTGLDPARPVHEQLSAGLDAHIDYFVAHRHTVLAANRVLAGDHLDRLVAAEDGDGSRTHGRGPTGTDADTH